jgi:oxidase EvaA
MNPTTDLRSALAASAAAVDGVATDRTALSAWLDDRRRAQTMQVNRVPVDDLEGWHFAPASGDLQHVTGAFYSVRGLRVRTDFGPVPAWEQPIIDQPEIGVLGIAMRDFDGIPHLLMQAKTEPGNVNGMQLSPTVQATRSNYTRVHGGAAVPYLEHFHKVPPEAVVSDVLQSEQGSWFLHKRNRNMIVRVGPDVQAGEDFIWLTLGQVHAMLQRDDVVNMDARTVLSGLPEWNGAPGDGSSLHPDAEVRSWLTRRRCSHDVAVGTVGLSETRGWHRSDRTVAHESGRHFRVVGVDVSAGRREVRSWSQPLLEPSDVGIVAMFVRVVAGTPHLLLRARVEPGFVLSVELGPTVQCNPSNYAHLPTSAQPPYLAEALAGRDHAAYDRVLSEEGGRFLNARSRYLILEAGDALPVVSDEFCWVSVHQVDELLRYSHNLNIEARTLIAALRAL